MIQYPSATTFPLPDYVEQRLCDMKGRDKYRRFDGYSFFKIATKFKYDDSKISEYLQSHPHCVRCWALVASESKELATQHVLTLHDILPYSRSARAVSETAFTVSIGGSLSLFLLL